MAFLKEREAHGILLLKRYFIMFVQEHAMGFLGLCELISKGTPQGYYASLRSLEIFFLRNINNTNDFAV